MHSGGVVAAALSLAVLLATTGLASASEVPDPRVTPGAINPTVTQDNIPETICRRGWTKTVRPPPRFTSTLKRRQLYMPGSPYYAPGTRMRDWEEDHRVPLGIGGDPLSRENLWPEPRRGEWSAERKDELEDVIHRLVCRRVLTLQEGQDVFLEDWRDGYRRYVLRER